MFRRPRGDLPIIRKLRAFWSGAKTWGLSQFARDENGTVPFADAAAGRRRESRPAGRRARWGGSVLVLAGLVLGQVILYGPSLLGNRILLPLDILAEPTVYLPRTPETEGVVPHDAILSDLVFYYEPARQFAVSEIRSGRLPLWSPYRYAGAACYRWSLSPPCLPGYFIASPRVLAWIQVLIALVAGSGAYVFFRHILRVGFWPAAIAAWCYPLTGAYIIWQGFSLPPVMCWLPWVLAAVDRAVRRPAGWGAPGLALLTAVVLLGGAADIGGQLLLASGIYAAWCLIDEARRGWSARRAMQSLAVTSLAWLLGILGSTWLLMPLVEYTSTGARAAARSQGAEERPPIGLESLPQVVVPEMYGSTQQGSHRIAADNVQESSVGAYAGLLAALLLAPLAWCSRRHRWSNALWVLLGFVGLSWSLNVPGVVQLLRLPGMNMMSHNRFVFVTSFAILAMAAVGLDVLRRSAVLRRRWFLLPVVLLASLGAWCLYRTAVLPEPVATQLGDAVRSGQVVGWIKDLAQVERVQHRFIWSYAVAAALSALAAGLWGWLWVRSRLPRWAFVTLGALLVGELLWFGCGRAAQCDPALYYPPVPVLEQIAAARPGRIIGCNCLPANLSQTHGLRDVRGYDGVDPVRLMDLLQVAAAPDTPVLPYTQSQWLMPEGTIVPPGNLRLSPILDMLGVRYVIFRGTPPPGIQPDFTGQDYWALTNENAMRRAFVPRHVKTIEDDRQRLRRLSATDFNPRRIAYVERPISLPPRCRGVTSVVEEFPTRVTISVDMHTAGIVVLADLWDTGWRAYFDGEPVPVLRVNHALRGVLLPAGQGTLHFRYEPASLRLGGLLAGFAALAWGIWVVAVAWTTRRSRREPRLAVPESADRGDGGSPRESMPSRGENPETRQATVPAVALVAAADATHRGTVPIVVSTKMGLSPLARALILGTQKLGQLSHRGLAALVCLVLLMAVVFVFGQTVQHPFISYDDDQYVYENRQVVQGLTIDGVAWAFTHRHVGNWHPLTSLSHMLDCQLYGLAPGPHHLTSVVLHALAAVLLFLVLRQMTGDLWPSAMVAAVFAVHPLRAESVAWVAERKDVLSGLFFMLTLAAYVRYVRRPFAVARYLLVVLFFTLGLMAKPMLVTTPLVLLLLDYWPLRRFGLPMGEDVGESIGAGSGRWPPIRLLVEKVPLLILAAACGATTLWAQRVAIQTIEGMPLAPRMANASVSCILYLVKLCYPVGLAPFYPHPGHTLPIWKAVGACLVLVAVSVAAWVWRKRRPYLAVGWLWYLVTLAPVCGLVQVGSQGMADRYTYLTLIGPCIILAWAAADVWRRWPGRRLAWSLSAALVVTCLAVTARRQTARWHDGETLWRHSLSCTSRNDTAHFQLAVALTNRQKLDEAIAHYQKALEIYPASAQTHNNLGLALSDLNRRDEAMPHFLMAIQCNPRLAAAHYNLGNELAGRGQLDGAIASYRRALELQPHFAEAHSNLGNALSDSGCVDEAIAHYREALRIKPDYAEAHSNLGNAFSGRGELDEAIVHYRKALELNPSYVTAHNNLGNALYRQEQVAEAISHYRQAIEIDPNHPNAYQNLGVVLYAQGQTDEALKLWRELLRLQTNHVGVLKQVAWILATSPEAAVRDGASAAEMARRASQLCGGKDPVTLDILSAAYAEMGRFQNAIQVARRGLALESKRGNNAGINLFRQRIATYQSRLPLRANPRRPDHATD